MREFKSAYRFDRFRRVRLTKEIGYWTFKDIWFVPYVWVMEEDIPQLPTPFVAFSIHYDCPIGRPGRTHDSMTNIIALPSRGENLSLSTKFQKELRRLDKLNADLKLVHDEENDLLASAKWFQDFHQESKRDLQRRLKVYRKLATWTAAYKDKELLGCHFTFEEVDTIHYMGCWWNREHKSRSIPTWLLQQDLLRAISDGKSSYDLGIGDEPYKKKWPVTEKPTKYLAIVDEPTMKELGFSPDEVELIPSG